MRQEKKKFISIWLINVVSNIRLHLSHHMSHLLVKEEAWGKFKLVTSML